MNRRCLMLVLFLICGRAAASSRFVAMTGKEGQSGSREAPWATLSAAIARVSPGDTIFVRGGMYTESEIWIRGNYGMGGKDGRYLTICAYADEIPLFTNSDRGLIIDASYVRIQGLHFSNGKSMYNVNWAGRSHHVEFIGNTLTGTTGYAAIMLTGDNNLVEKNIIRLDGNVLGTQGHGIYVQEGKNNILRGNTISGMSGYGIHLYEEKRSEDPPGYRRLVQNVVVENNVIFASQERSGIIVAAGADSGPADIRDILLRGNIIYGNAVAGIVVQGWSPVTRVRIYHNTLSNNREGDLLVGGTVDSVEVSNNILSHSGRRPHISVEGSVTHFTARRNLYYPSPKTLENASDAEALEAAPGFVDADHNDFSLRPGSPAIDAGIDLGWPFTGSAPDLGAIESDLHTSAGSAPEENAQAEGLYFENGTPNPCNGEMQLHYRLAADSAVKMEIYDVTGRRVTTLVDAQQSKGLHSLRWNGSDDRGRRVPSGLYFCLLRTDSEQIVQKLIRAY